MYQDSTNYIIHHLKIMLLLSRKAKFQLKRFTLNLGYFIKHQMIINFYHVTCKMILYNYPENSAPLSDDSYDYEFFLHFALIDCEYIKQGSL